MPRICQTAPGCVSLLDVRNNFLCCIFQLLSKEHREISIRIFVGFIVDVFSNIWCNKKKEYEDFTWWTMFTAIILRLSTTADYSGMRSIQLYLWGCYDTNISHQQPVRRCRTQKVDLSPWSWLSRLCLQCRLHKLIIHLYFFFFFFLRLISLREIGTWT